jgi:tol-pal system protein YbgF
MKTKLAVMALIMSIAAAPAADAAWWNPFKKDTPPTAGNAQNTPVPEPMGEPTSIAPPASVGGAPAAYGAAPVPGPVPAGVPANAAAVPVNDPVGRVERLEATVRNLTGQVEMLSYQLKQAQDQIRVLQGGASSADVSRGRRVNGGPSGVVAVDKGVGVNLSETPMDGVEVVGDDAIGAKIANGPGAPVHRGEPPKVLGTIPANAAPPPAAAVASAQPAPVTGPAPNVRVVGPQGAVLASAPSAAEDPRTAFDRAYQLILTGDYEPAEKSLKAFLAAYPNDKLAGDAQYWLGESFYARGLYRDAATVFLAGVKTYPKGSKAPETLLKLGLSLKGMGQRDEACNTFAEVTKRFPKSSNAMLQRVKAEQASANCT